MFWNKLNKIISLDLGNKNIKIVVGRQQGNHVLVENAMTIPTPIHSYDDGQILDKKSLKSLIHGTLESSKIRAKKAVCSIESTSIITREISLPKVKENEMASMVRYEVEQYLPVILDDYVVEYKLLDEFEEEGMEKSRVLVAAIPKIMVENILELIGDINLKPLALDLNSNAISKIFNQNVKINGEIPDRESTIAIIDIGYKFINMDIISKGVVQFSRLIPLAGKDIDINIANHFNLSVEEAEEKKINDCNIQQNMDLTPSKAMLNEAVKSSIEGWIVEIQRVIQYYKSRNLGNRIHKVYIHGGSSNLIGIAQYMENLLEMPVEKIEKIDKIKLSKSVDSFDVVKYLNAIGAIIRLGR